LNGSELEIVNEFNYLGILFNRTGNFNKAIKKQAEKATKAMFEDSLQNTFLFKPVLSLYLAWNHFFLKILFKYGPLSKLCPVKTITLVLSVFAFNLQVLQYSPNLFKIFCKSSWVSASRTVSSAYKSAKKR
jgi:hypothetical protein